MSKKKKFIIICLILCFILSIQAISAVEIDKSQNIGNETDIISISQENQEIMEISDNDDKLGAIEAPGGTFTDLKNILNSANNGDTIYLTGDYTFIEGSDDDYGDDFAHNTYAKSITFDGQGHTIDAKNKSSILILSNKDHPDKYITI